MIKTAHWVGANKVVVHEMFDFSDFFLFIYLVNSQ